MPDITRIFKGRDNDFGVEIVFAEAGESSPAETHPYKEIVVAAKGRIDITIA